MTPEFPYVELPGTHRGLLRKASLWEGADHVLAIKGTRFNEEYRRFYYRDIQAFVVEKRARAGSLGWWLILLGLFFISLFPAGMNDPPFSWLVSVVLLAFIGVRLDLTLRRSCRCSIQTAVSREQLSSALRRPAAEAAFARLRLRIAAEQGDLPDEIPASEEDAVAGIRPVERPVSGATALEEAARYERRRAAGIGCKFALAALLLLSLNSAFLFWFAGSGGLPAKVLPWLNYAFLGLEGGAMFLCLRHVDGIPALRSLKYLIAAALAFCFGRLTLGWIMAPLYFSYFQTSGADGLQAFNRKLNIANGALLLALASAGFIAMAAKWETYRRGEPSSR